MKKLIILFVLLFIKGSIYAQIGSAKFSPDSSRWSQRAVVPAGPMNTLYFFWHYRIKGDTIVGGKYMQKVFRTNTSSIPIDTNCSGTQNLLYFDSNRVFLDSNLIYDFNLLMGDTFNFYVHGPVHNGYFPFVVNNVDSVFIGNRWRKRIILANTGFNFSPVKWVEGIGDIVYGFNSSYGSVESYIYTGGYGQLTCFSEHWQNTFGVNCTYSNGSCLTGIKENNSLEGELIISPQPASEEICIQSVQVLFGKEEEILIYDMNGQKREVPAIYINANTYKLDVSGLNAGMYVAFVNTDKGTLRKKIIIEK